MFKEKREGERKKQGREGEGDKERKMETRIPKNKEIDKETGKTS